MSDSWKNADEYTKTIFHELYEEGREIYTQRLAEYYNAKSQQSQTTEKNPTPATSACNIRSNAELFDSINPVQKVTQCRKKAGNISSSDTSTGLQLQSQGKTSVDMDATMETLPRSMMESSSIIRSIPTTKFIAEENDFEVDSLMQDDFSSTDDNQFDEEDHDISPEDYMAMIGSLIEESSS